MKFPLLQNQVSDDQLDRTQGSEGFDQRFEVVTTNSETVLWVDLVSAFFNDAQSQGTLG